MDTVKNSLSPSLGMLSTGVGNRETSKRVEYVHGIQYEEVESFVE